MVDAHREFQKRRRRRRKELPVQGEGVWLVCILGFEALPGGSQVVEGSPEQQQQQLLLHLTHKQVVLVELLASMLAR